MNLPQDLIPYRIQLRSAVLALTKKKLNTSLLYLCFPVSAESTAKAVASADPSLIAIGDRSRAHSQRDKLILVV